MDDTGIAYRVPPPMTRADLDRETCADPACDHTAHDGPLVLHAQCHIDAATWVTYHDGVMAVTCAECGALIAAIAVAPGLSGPQFADPGIMCSAVTGSDDEADEDYPPGPCAAISRFVVARTDGDPSYGVNGGSDEACEEHLAETVAEMIEGDPSVGAVVTVRWDRPEEPS